MVVSRNCYSGSILKVNVLVFAYGLKIILKVKKKKIKEDSVFFAWLPEGIVEFTEES